MENKNKSPESFAKLQEHSAQNSSSVFMHAEDPNMDKWIWSCDLVSKRE